MLVPAAALNRIKAQVGPKTDEGVWRVVEPGALTPSGSGFIKGSQVTTATVAGRVIYIGNLSAGQRVQADIPRTDANYIVTLEANTVLSDQSFLVESALPWVASHIYATGDHVVPTTPNGYIYIAKQGGLSFTAEPSWPTSAGDFGDHDVIWTFVGKENIFDVVEVMTPSTFGAYISTRVMANRRQL